MAPGQWEEADLANHLLAVLSGLNRSESLKTVSPLSLTALSQEQTVQFSSAQERLGLATHGFEPNHW
jgi:hypothetical protein